MADQHFGEPGVMTPAALRDIRHILRWSVREFGSEAALRYRDLLIQALRDIEADPQRPGSKEHPDLMIHGVRTYHLSFSRNRVPGIRVKKPRHFLLYRSSVPGVIEISRLLDDSRDLARHLPKGYRRANTGVM